MIFLIDENDKPKEILNAENAKHLKVLRPGVGDEVAILNLRGQAKVYVVTSIKPLELEFKKSIDAEKSKIETHLFLAPPSDSALEQAVEQATEVGYDHLHFFRSTRVQVPTAKSLPFARLKRIVQASCKQCGRMWAPQIDENLYSFSQAVEKAKNTLMICADEDVARDCWGSLKGTLPTDKSEIAIFIGPEGGWSKEERIILHGAGRTFSLGPHVLRVPTAVVSAYALCWKEIQNERE
jgi:16S rRNA (uracil1498-N3)-methyltransferase